MPLFLQESKVVGAAYKPRDHARGPELLFTKVQYGWMRYQVRYWGACDDEAGGWGPLSLSVATTWPSSGVKGPLVLSRILGHRQVWVGAGLTGLFAKVLAEATDTSFILEAAPHWACGGRSPRD